MPKVWNERPDQPLTWNIIKIAQGALVKSFETWTKTNMAPLRGWVRAMRPRISAEIAKEKAIEKPTLPV